MTPTRRLHEAGQSLWLDYIRRSLITGGRLQRYIDEDGLRGMTSNPSIFEQAIAGSDDYDDQLAELLAADPRAGAERLYEQLAIHDIRLAADALRPIWDASGGGDGYVSLEVSPYLAYDTGATVDEVRRLWDEVERPNLMVKVPATAAGIPAIETLTGEGINVNVTLMFSLDHYEAVARAYVAGLETLAGRDPDAVPRVASVASFFVSRVDGKVDPKLEAIGSDHARALRGHVAVDNAKLAYARFREIFHGPDFAALRDRGARVQRVLYGSTSTKNPDYSDVLYVEELIGQETVNTLPPKTIDAFRDHGTVEERLTADVDASRRRVAALADLGVELDAVTEELQREGVAAFARSFDQLLAAIETERRRMLGERAGGRQSIFVANHLAAVGRRLQEWQDAGFGRRLWAGDRSLWSAGPAPEIVDRLGWLTLPDSQPAAARELAGFAAGAAEGTDDVLLLGMGGSSLAPEVFQRVFGETGDRPRLTVLDSTHPEAVRAAGERYHPARTLYVVASKSGSTVETLSLLRWFWARAVDELGEGEAGSRFVAVTDPGSQLHALAEKRSFRRVVTAPPEVGGRYSALTPFGLLPAALIGVDVERLLDRARGAAFAFAPERPASVNEALTLAAALAELARAGRDKLVFWTTDTLAAFPDWLEQLVAESLGKDGRGIVPVVGSPPELPVGDDQVVCALRLDGDPEPAWAPLLPELEAVGCPVLRVRLADRYDLGAEMLRWELAVAAAGAALGVNPFDQPDVQRAKDLARRALEGSLEVDDAGVAVDDGVLPRRLAAWLDTVGAGDYLAVQAWLPPDDATGAALAALQRALAERTGRAVTVGYGPRFLHSTGQLHKGGPAGGLFLQLVDDPGDALPIPEDDASFGRLVAGQALGDRRALEQAGRRVLTVRLGDDRAGGLERLLETVRAAAPAVA